jgi:hypothetical protein
MFVSFDGARSSGSWSDRRLIVIRSSRSLALTITLPATCLAFPATPLSERVVTLMLPLWTPGEGEKAGGLHEGGGGPPAQGGEPQSRDGPPRRNHQ